MPRIFILIAAKSTACQTEDELFLCQGLQLVYQVAGEGPGVLLADGVQQRGWCLIDGLVCQAPSIEKQTNNLTRSSQVLEVGFLHYLQPKAGLLHSEVVSLLGSDIEKDPLLHGDIRDSH